MFTGVSLWPHAQSYTAGKQTLETEKHAL